MLRNRLDKMIEKVQTYREAAVCLASSTPNPARVTKQSWSDTRCTELNMLKQIG